MSKYKVKLNHKEFEVKLVQKNGASLKFEVAGHPYEVNLEPLLTTETTDSEDEVQIESGQIKELTSPMPGVITKIAVKEKENVKKGQVLLTIEAMKMENSIFAPINAKVKKIKVKVGQEVKNQDLLLSFE